MTIQNLIKELRTKASLCEKAAFHLEAAADALDRLRDAQPANKPPKAKRATQRSIIYDAIVDSPNGITRQGIALAIRGKYGFTGNIPVSAISTYLTRLRKEGMIRKIYLWLLSFV